MRISSYCVQTGHGVICSSNKATLCESQVKMIKLKGFCIIILNLFDVLLLSYLHFDVPFYFSGQGLKINMCMDLMQTNHKKLTH